MTKISIAVLLLFCCAQIEASVANPQYNVTTNLSVSNDESHSAILSVTLKTTGQVKLNHDAPIALEISTNDGIQLNKTKFDKNDAILDNESKKIVWPIALKLKSPGMKIIKGHLRFYLCTDKWCRKFEQELIESVQMGSGAA